MKTPLFVSHRSPRLVQSLNHGSVTLFLKRRINFEMKIDSYLDSERREALVCRALGSRGR